MKIKLAVFLLVALTSAVAVSAQKAEPNRISFAKGKSSATVTGVLSNDQEMDFVFGAGAGQTVTMTVTSEPRGNLFDFSIGGDGFEFDTDEDHYAKYTFTAPETGDYLVTVRKRPGQAVRKAKFIFKLTIR